jgi:hypothetical protein
MSREVTGVRPAVFRTETRAALEPFRSFRHLARHRYGFDLEWMEIEPLLATTGSTVNALISDLEAFCDFLDQIQAQGI